MVEQRARAYRAATLPQPPQLSPGEELHDKVMTSSIWARDFDEINTPWRHLFPTSSRPAGKATGTAAGGITVPPL